MHKTTWGPVALCCALWMAGCLGPLAVAWAQPADDAGGPRPGPVVAIGGALRDDNAAVWGRLVALAGGPGARFVVLATASGDPARSAALAVAQLQRHGAVAEALPVAPLIPGIDLGAAVRDLRWTAAVRGARGVFFTGGAQARLVDTLRPGGVESPLLQALRELHARGGVIAGTSSGAAVMSAVMFRDAPDVLSALQRPLHDGTEVDRGLGFLPPGVLVDQHFVKRGRIGRLLPLMAARDLPLGIGVEEDSAAIVQGTTLEVVGARGVVVADLHDATHGTREGALVLQGARLHWLEAGDRYDLATRRVSSARPDDRRIDPYAPGFTGYHAGPAFYPDMLGDGTLVVAMQRLLDSPHHEVLGLSFAPGSAMGHEWRLYKAADSVGWTPDAGDGATVANLRLDLRPVRMAVPLYTPWPPP